jgi:histidinol-phosphate aminotransferase
VTGPGGLPLREDLVGRTPYGAPQLDVAVRLNVNENPYGPSEELAAAIGTAVSDAARTLNRYPDREALALREALAGYLGDREGHVTDPTRVWAANGSNEVMLQLFQAFGGPGRTALGFAPTYSMYPDYCRDTFTRWVTAPREKDFSLDPEVAVDAVRDLRPAIVVLTSPNNPTGTALPMETLRAVCGVAPGLVVVDEAYAEFRRPGTPSALELLADQPRLVVTRTMSKAFALAGARIGYLTAAPEVVDAVRLVRLPYHLSSVTQAVGRAALAHAEELQAPLARLREERDALLAWLREKGVDHADSDANFVLFGTFADRHAAWEGLLAHGVLVRETGPEGWLRVSVGTPEEMAAFRTALRDVRDRGVGAAEPAA